MARVIAVCMSDEKGVQKQSVAEGLLVANHGLEGDAHAGPHHRQVSLLARESVDKMRAKGAEVGPGSFGENVVTEGIDLLSLPVGTRVRIGEAEAEVTQHGKKCHDRCFIYDQVGDCVMPREGIFVRVLKGGTVKQGDGIEVIGDEG